MKTVNPWVAAIVLVVVLFISGGVIYDKFIGHKTSVNAYDNLTPGPIVNAKAEILIEGPTEIKIGQLARFDVTKSAGKTFKWKTLPPTTNFEVYDDGRKAVFSSSASGEFTFIVACANDNDVDVKTLTIKVGEGDTPAPTPPGPVNPATGVAGKVVEFSKLVNSPNKKAEATKLAAGFTGVAKQVQDGQLTTAEQIIEAQAIANRTALGNGLTAWVPFLTALQKEMKTEAEAGLLVTPEQHATLWVQIANGLTIVAK
ncbi:hypothetical protein M0R72_15530 [Candidatus Pacearchaeota archaeon]|jgi:hypothetical protein|nr:hypothetical protein [Candidatus Pacearchaeota archaeon]